MEQTVQLLNASTAPRERAVDAALSREFETQKLPVFVRPLIAALLLIVAVLVGHLSPARAWFADVTWLREAIARGGMWTIPISFLVVAALVACGVPRLILSILGGTLFGFWIGLPITLLGALLGHFAIFRIVRWGGRDWAMQHWPVLHKWNGDIHCRGTVGVIVARLLPVHALLINLSLGLSNVKNRQFLLGSLAGLAPEAIAATLLGAGLIGNSLRTSIGYVALASALLGAFAIAVQRFNFIDNDFGIRSCPGATQRRSASAAADCSSSDPMRRTEL